MRSVHSLSILSWLLVAVVTTAVPSPVEAQDRWLAADKAAHFGATLGISVGSYAGAALITEQERWRVASGLGAGLGTAAAKELWDRSHNGHPSWRDFAWSAVGTAAGTTVAWLINRARRPSSVSPPLQFAPSASAARVR